MSILSERAARTRIQSCKVGEWTFVVREPSRLDMSERGSVNSGSIQREVLERYVVDWSGFKESDLFTGGSPDVVQFDQDMFKEWIGYHPECWGPISDLVVKMYTDGQVAQVAREEALKNLVAG